jgi:hypothetical protein
MVACRPSINICCGLYLQHCSLSGMFRAVDLRNCPPFRLARTAEFVEADQSDSPSPVSFQKIFRFSFYPNQIHIARVPPQHKGRFAIVTNVERDAVAADSAVDERRVMRTAKSCGPDAPTLASSWRRCFASRR